MKLVARSKLRLVAIVVIATAGPASAEIDTMRSPVRERPRVEFVEVEDQECLKPVLNSDSAQIVDYRAAERRWLAKKYPGMAFPRWETVIMLASQPDADSRAKTFKRETAYGYRSDGVSVTVCFDIDLTDRSREQSSPRPPV